MHLNSFRYSEIKKKNLKRKKEAKGSTGRCRRESLVAKIKVAAIRPPNSTQLNSNSTQLNIITAADLLFHSSSDQFLFSYYIYIYIFI